MRLQFLTDLKRRIRFVSKGYSPKVYDGDWVKISRIWLEDRLKGATIAADCHYSEGKSLKQVKFVIPFEKPKGKG